MNAKILKCCGKDLELFGVMEDGRWKYYCRECSRMHYTEKKDVGLMIDYTVKKVYKKFNN